MSNTDYRNKLVVKSNRLMESKYHLSVREQKFIIFLASLIDKDTMHLKETSIKIKQVEAALKSSNDKKWGSVYEVVRDVVHSIHSKPLDIRKPDGGWTMISWFARVDADAGQGIITFEFTAYIKEQLIQLKEHFSQYRFENILSLKSGYSIRIYELLKVNQFKGSVTYELSHFRELIGASYKDENMKWVHKYEQYKIFKNRIIKHAQKELKRETDIYFEIKEEREGRSVKYITFYMFKNKKNNSGKQNELFKEIQPEIEIDDYDYTLSLIESFVKIGLSEEKAKKMYREGFNIIEKDEVRKEIVSKGRSLDEYFFEKIDYTNFMISKGDISNPPGLLLTAIKQNYKSKEIEKNQKIKTARKKRLELEKIKEAKEKKLLDMGRAISQKENEIIMGLIGSSENFFEEVLKDEHPNLWIGYDNLKSLSENGLAAKGVFRAKLNSIIKKQFPESFKSLELEIEEYEKKKKQVHML